MTTCGVAIAISAASLVVGVFALFQIARARSRLKRCLREIEEAADLEDLERRLRKLETWGRRK